MVVYEELNLGKVAAAIALTDNVAYDHVEAGHRRGKWEGPGTRDGYEELDPGKVAAAIALTDNLAYEHVDLKRRRN